MTVEKVRLCGSSTAYGAPIKGAERERVERGKLNPKRQPQRRAAAKIRAGAFGVLFSLNDCQKPKTARAGMFARCIGLMMAGLLPAETPARASPKAKEAKRWKTRCSA